MTLILTHFSNVCMRLEKRCSNQTFSYHIFVLTMNTEMLNNMTDCLSGFDLISPCIKRQFAL